MVEGESDEDDTLYEARGLRRSEVTHFLSLPVRGLGLEASICIHQTGCWLPR